MKSSDFYPTVVDAGIRATVALELPFTEAGIREGVAKVASRHPGGGKVVINMEMER
jgi:hypothetical protein